MLHTSIGNYAIWLGTWPSNIMEGLIFHYLIGLMADKASIFTLANVDLMDTSIPPAIFGADSVEP